ncbi:hypothetical protein [Pseudopedobacter sp.]|uniref:hypothetical protein n=1 Tax=Pseudopedobacter sp. TaxID=1936787 RepID=UPI00333F542B
MNIQKIACIVAGYVGGASMSVVAQKNPYVQVVVDLNRDRLVTWNDIDLQKLPVYEPGLDQVVSER